MFWLHAFLYTTCTQCLQKPEEGIRTPETRVTDGCEESQGPHDWSDEPGCGTWEIKIYKHKKPNQNWHEVDWRLSDRDLPASQKFSLCYYNGVILDMLWMLLPEYTVFKNGYHITRRSLHYLLNSMLKSSKQHRLCQLPLVIHHNHMASSYCWRYQNVAIRHK